MREAKPGDLQQAEPSNVKGLRVLVVEDSWHVARAMKSLLEDLGMEVAGPAATLADAEQLATTQQPDVAIVDINLKGEMAYGLIDRLHDRGVRVIVISGYAVPQVTQGKAVGVLQKPFSAKSLLGILHQVAARTGAR